LRYFTSNQYHDFQTIASVLRLSSKYFVEHLRLRCIERLEKDWPTTLEAWDRREQGATDSQGRYTPRDHYAHPILVMQLAIELGLQTLLSSVFYDLSRYGPSKIALGVLVPHPPLSLSDTSPVKLYENTLSEQQLVNTFHGRERGQEYIARFVLQEIYERPLSVDCPNRDDIPRVRDCRESHYFIALNVFRSVGGIACGRDADPLYTLMQAIDMLSRTDFSDGQRKCGLKMCAPCKVEFRETCQRARQEIWNLLPSWFGFVDDAPGAAPVLEDAGWAQGSLP
jgi:hypothetical protein